MELKATQALVAGTPTVVLDGVIDVSTIAVFRDALLRCVHANPGTTVLVDLEEVTAIDDSGLGILLGAAADARQRDGDLEVVCTGARLRTRLERTRLDRAITVRGSVAG